MLTRGWSFTTPPIITGMKGSCVIIPCRFTYATSLPADLRVIWYLYQSNEYPPVFDQTQTVVSKFRGLTSSIGSVSEGNCSLKIEKLDMSHNQDRLYPWIDKNSIHSYHTTGYQFYDKTTQLIVSGEYLDTFMSPLFSHFHPGSKKQSLDNCSCFEFQRTCTRATAEHHWYPQSGRAEQSVLQCETHMHLCSSHPDSKWKTRN